MKPKEGTILTVAKGAAEKALELSDETEDVVTFVEEVIKQAEYVLDQTPEMLPVLKQAGVVDSGGQGLVQVLKGAYDALSARRLIIQSRAHQQELLLQRFRLRPRQRLSLVTAQSLLLYSMRQCQTMRSTHTRHSLSQSVTL